ncbi:MAG: thioredoxin domain-containing protein [Crocinitomicaceae bacterium]|nr:thioredoxin domain-containing protein [Crocinitomicaceae bacterium]
MEKFTNELIHETSPYLLQHAHNPVNWLPWSKEAFEKAEKENKLVLISVGYSACHWCHVMEKESFENEEVAAIMNELFVCIKVDREERPDVDQVYMTAVQLMTQQGGWPLNCFTLPNGNPIYGGTYFQKENWMHILKSLYHSFRSRYDEVEEYALKLKDGVMQSELIETPQPLVSFEKKKLDEIILRWTNLFDKEDGGNARAPKFPLPSNYLFLLRYGVWDKNTSVLNHVFLSLDKMAMGGIYDQIAGGFARYSVDTLWKVPHFEKMLYDNAQLLSLYSKAYQQHPKELYKRTVYQTVEWLKREMMTSEGCFYSAIDADSEGVEGKFYVWTESELQTVLGADYSWVKDFYSVNGKGYWEEGNYILLRSDSDEDFAKQMNWDLPELESNIARINLILRKKRDSRIRPGLDNKSLTAWNAMLITGFIDAYFAFEEEEFLQLALKTGQWIVDYQATSDGKLKRNFNQGKSNIDGFLEDYAHTIAAFTAIYQATFDEKWLAKAKELNDFTLEHFHDSKSKMFFFTSDETELIARKMEINDNVIPASNSVMANNLFLLGKFYDDANYIEIAQQMIANVYDGMEHYGSGYSNWANGMLNFIQPFAEVSITGANWRENAQKIAKTYFPNGIIMGGTTSELTILKDKFSNQKDQLFVCHSNHCLAPEEEPSAIIEIIKGLK